MHTPLNDAGRVRSYALTHRGGRVDVAWTVGGVRDVKGEERRLVCLSGSNEDSSTRPGPPPSASNSTASRALVVLTTIVGCGTSK